MRLQNKIAIVTGAGSGIGRAIAQTFTREGAKVVVADRDATGGEETVRLIKEAGGEVVFIQTDVSQAAAVEQLVKTMLESYGRIDILVNNAGIVKQAPFHETTEADWDAVLDVNLKGVFLVAKNVLPTMLKQGGGKIVNIASIAGQVGFAGSAPYCASKGGIIALTRALAVEYAPQKINVNGIAPGVIETAMTKETLADPTARQSLESATPYPRLGQPEDIAQAALYLASTESDFVNGEILVVDGGWTAK